MPDPRNSGHGPKRIPSFGHQFGALHDRVVGKEEPDENFINGISNKKKVDYVCSATRISPLAFHLDLPLPMEDWALSDDTSLILSGLYFSDLRRQFYLELLHKQPELQNGPAFHSEADAQFWTYQFNRAIHKRQQGVVLADDRVLH